MDCFKSEKSQIDKRIHEVHSQLEELGVRGKIMNDKLHKVKNGLKSPRVDSRLLLGTPKTREDIEEDVKSIKDELDAYYEKASILIGDLTLILTQIGYEFGEPSLIVVTKLSVSGHLEQLFRGKDLSYMSSLTPLLSLFCGWSPEERSPAIVSA